MSHHVYNISLPKSLLRSWCRVPLSMTKDQGSMSDVQVLYSFCVSRSIFREAAAAQLSLARRLRDEAPQQLEQIIAALSKPIVAIRMPLPCREALHVWHMLVLRAMTSNLCSSQMHQQMLSLWWSLHMHGWRILRAPSQRQLSAPS